MEFIVSVFLLVWKVPTWLLVNCLALLMEGRVLSFSICFQNIDGSMQERRSCIALAMEYVFLALTHRYYVTIPYFDYSETCV